MANDFEIPELVPSGETMPPIKSELETAQDVMQAMCDRVQDLRRKIYVAKTDIAKAGYRGQLIEVVRQLNNARLDYLADGINVCVTYSECGCPIRVNRLRKTEFYE